MNHLFSPEEVSWRKRHCNFSFKNKDRRAFQASKGELGQRMSSRGGKDLQIIIIVIGRLRDHDL
jgi:hypothetical protein